MLTVDCVSTYFQRFEGVGIGDLRDRRGLRWRGLHMPEREESTITHLHVLDTKQPNIAST